MLELQLLTILCSLAAIVFATVAPRSVGHWLTMGVAFAGITVALAAGHFVDQSAAAGITGVAAIGMLVRPWFGHLLAAALAGAAAGLAAVGLVIQGLPLPAALVLTAAAPALSAWLYARNEGFARPIMREEALLIVAGLGILLAIGPDMVAGWQSAVALRAQPVAAPALEMNAWAFIAVGACLSLGCLWAYLRRGR